MSYIENPNEVVQSQKHRVDNEVNIKVQKEFFQKSAAQNSVQKNDDLKSFVSNFFESKGIAYDASQLNNSNEIVLNDLHSMDLHSLTLKAEELGKNITFTRSLTIKISD